MASNAEQVAEIKRAVNSLIRILRRLKEIQLPDAAGIGDDDLAERVEDLETKCGRLDSIVGSGTVEVLHNGDDGILLHGTGGAEARPTRSGRKSGAFPARITAYDPQNSECEYGATQWKYSWVEVYKAAPGYGNWQPRGRSGTLNGYNDAEDINDCDGVQGNGVAIENLVTDDFAFALQPVPAGAIVWMREVEVETGTPGGGQILEYHFTHENGVDGECI